MMMPDWNQIRGFAATAQEGSLSAAARKLGLTQPTLSRQVAALEECLGVTLFERLGKSLILTETGASLLDHARGMVEAADMLALAASGRSETVEGIVSISAADGIAHFMLPRALERIAAEAPGITVEVVVSNALSDLRRREADIAIRHVRPEEPELTGRLLREARAGFYASENWVDAHGLPERAGDLAGASFIGFDRAGQFATHLEGLGIDTGKVRFPLLTENSVLGWEMTRRGFGIGVMMCEIADTMPGLVRVLNSLPEISFPFWLVTHREMRTSRRIRIVFDILAEELGRPGLHARSG